MPLARLRVFELSHYVLPGDDGLDTPSGVGLKLLAHAIMDIASALTVRLDTFSLGRISTLIGELTPKWLFSNK
jgi:hypothetical protein